MHLHMEHLEKSSLFDFVEWLTFGLGSTFLGIFIVLPIIMLGAALSKWKVIERAAEIKGKLVIVTVIGLAVGLWMKMLAAFRGVDI